MNVIAIIGLGNFALNVLDQLISTSTDLIILDKDREIVEKYKKFVSNAYIADAINTETLKTIIPENLTAAILDLGSSLESSILVTNHLKKIGVNQIIAKACSDDHGEILELVGATKVIYPDFDAACHIVPQLLSPVLLNYLKISENFVIAEVTVKPELTGKTLKDSLLRQKFGLNVIGYRKNFSEDFQNANDPNLILSEDITLLASGSVKSIHEYSNATQDLKTVSKNEKTLFSDFFHRK